MKEHFLRHGYFLKKCFVLLFIMMGVILVTSVASRADTLRIGVAGYDISQTVSNACKALNRLGVEAVRVDSVEDDLESLDGLIIPGGPDVNPGFYNEENRECGWLRNSLDYIQLHVLDAFLETGRPVLGICRGMQLINVYYGGTLNQNIEGHQKGRHLVENVPGTWCYEIFGQTVETNTSHHQSLKDLGEGLYVCAMSQDTIEAVKHESLPVYAVQWHPENKPRDVGNRLFNYWFEIVNKHRFIRNYLEKGEWGKEETHWSDCLFM